MARLPTLAVLLVGSVVAGASCTSPPVCESPDVLSVRGDSVFGGVAVTQDGERVTLTFTDPDNDAVTTNFFDVVGPPLDDAVGELVVETGTSLETEGSSYAYLRISDDRGVWFEGGDTPTVNGARVGGAELGGPFRAGEPVGASCARTPDTNADVLEVVAALDDEPDGVVVGSGGHDGVWRGVPVHVVGLFASRWTDVFLTDTIDGPGAGVYDRSDVTGYLYRRRE